MLDIKILLDNPEDYNKYLKVAEEFELNGEFNTDADEPSYEGTIPVDANFEFIKKGFKNAWQHFVCTKAIKIYTSKINKMLETKIVGKKNLKGVKAGIVTCNHVSKYDSFMVRKAVGYNIKFVAADFNNWDNKIGHIARHTGYLPLSAKFSVMRKFNEAVEYYLNKGKRILIYPEQAMWRDYKKPRPMKDGAFHYAVKHNVPIIPLFITFADNGKYENGVPRYKCTINILPPIYKNRDLTDKENIEYMRKANFESWKECYEITYGKSLEYTTKDQSKIKI